MATYPLTHKQTLFNDSKPITGQEITSPNDEQSIKIASDVRPSKNALMTPFYLVASSRDLKKHLGGFSLAKSHRANVDQRYKM